MKDKNTQTAKGKGFAFALESFCSKNKLVLWIVCSIILLGIPLLGLSQYLIRVFIMIGIYSLLGLGLNLLTGYTGQVSLGHAGFFAIGAYTFALLSIHFQMNFILAFIISAALTGLCGLLLGLPTMRLSGSYLTIVTLGFGEIVKMVLLNWSSVTNGPMGIKNIPKPQLFGHELTLANGGMYYTMLVLILLVSLLCVAIINSRTGRAFIAIKDDELAATMMGIRTSRFKILSFVFSAGIAGLAGAFYAPVIGYIDPNTFTFDVSTLIISIVILGGMGTMRGIYLGAAILIAFPEIARFLMDWRFVVYGLVLVVMMRFRPQGLLGWKSQMPYKLPKLTRTALESRKVKNAPTAGNTSVGFIQ